MKIVLAEKVSPATLAVFAAEPGWEVLTHDQLPDGLAGGAGRCRCAGGAQRGAGGRRADGAGAQAARDWPGRGGSGQHRRRCGDAAGHCGDEYAGRERGGGGRADHRPDAGAGAQAARGQYHHARGKVGEEKPCKARELRGKTLGILGLGRDRAWKWRRRAKGFGLEILGSDPFVSAAVARENGIKLVTLEELMAGSDYITLHVGLTAQTAGVINAKTIAAMKKGVRIVNCARGELVDDAALVEALKSGQVAGAALDVFTVEPAEELALRGAGQRDFDAAYRRLDGRGAGGGGGADRHAGARVSEAGRGAECHEFALADARGVHATGAVHRPGGAAGVVSGAGGQARGIEAIHLIYGGSLAEAKIDLVRNAAIEGLLQGSENVNRINATAVAQERGIRVHEEKQESHRGGAATVLTVELHAAAGASHASATVIHGEQPRLLEFDGIDIETPLEGNLLVCRNLDVPGVIGKIGTILGEHGVNIANFALGRERSGPKPVKALAVVQVDAPVSERCWRRWGRSRRCWRRGR